MARIRILPETLSNKIAAGEVVERPASVVKELVENSLDANAHRIRIAIENGGRALIQVADDGDGMSPDDALLCLERYATSKIRSDADLFAIGTLGFRGEALPSIAAVSRFNLISRARDRDEGCEIQVDGGTIRRVTATGAPVGTMLTVRSLFYNTPARRKFLKTVNTEMSHIGDVVAGMGLAWPRVGFQLLNNQRRIKNWPAVNDPAERVAAVLGREVRPHLHPVHFEADYLKLTGWVAHSRFTRSTSRAVFVFVNGRMVRDRTILHGVLAGYQGRLMKGQYPLAAVFLEVPPDQVDVNVHPTKHEVRLGRARQVHNGLVQAVGATLAAAEKPIWQGAQVSMSQPAAATEQAGEARSSYATSQKPLTTETHRAIPPPPRPSQSLSRPVPGAPPEPVPATALKAPRQQNIWSENRLESLHVIGQFAHTYIVCETGKDLVLVDQHAAHERIYFERLKYQSAAGRPAVQQLLLPETVDLGFREAEILDGLLDDLTAHGLEVGRFGGNTFAIRAIPAFLSAGGAEKILREIAEKAAIHDTAPELGTALERSLYVMACHGAIRANQRLDGKQMKIMLEQLGACRNPAHCPHGRPTWIEISRRELDKRFRRIV